MFFLLLLSLLYTYKSYAYAIDCIVDSRILTFNTIIDKSRFTKSGPLPLIYVYIYRYFLPLM